METTTMRRRVEEARSGRLATVTPDGRPHIVPQEREPPPGPVIAIDLTGWRAWP